MTEMSVTALPREPRLLIAIVRAFCVCDGQHEARRAVEEPELQEIDAQESANPMRERSSRMMKANAARARASAVQ